MMGMYKRDGSCGAESEIDGRKSSRWRRREAWGGYYLGVLSSLTVTVLHDTRDAT